MISKSYIARPVQAGPVSIAQINELAGVACESLTELGMVEVLGPYASVELPDGKVYINLARSQLTIETSNKPKTYKGGILDEGQ